jgi:hypothetical protein
LVLALVGLLLALKFLPGSSNGSSSTPPATASVGTGAQPNGKPTRLTIPGNQVRVVDPGGDRTELAGAGNVVDGDAGTSWQTQHYNTPAFGKLKPGMGILIDLGAPKNVSTVTIQFTNPGATVDLRSGTTNPPSTKAGDQQVLDGYKAIGQPREDAPSNTVFNANGSPVQYLLVWLSNLPVSIDDPTRFRVGIDEIQVTANP